LAGKADDITPVAGTTLVAAVVADTGAGEAGALFHSIHNKPATSSQAINRNERV
jgi:hypothetical protein